MKVVALIEGGKPIIKVLGAPFAVNCMVRTAFFDRRQGAWIMPYGELHSLMNALSRFAYHFEDRVSSGISDGDELLLRLRSQTLSDSYEHKTKPFAHQVEGFYYGMACPNFLLADEQGLGKSKQAIDLAINRKKMYGIKHCLIVCGVSALRFNWRNEVSKHSDEGALILGERLLRKGPKAGQLRLGGNKEKLEDAERLASGDESVPFFVITNIESLRDSTEKVEGKKKKERVKSPIRDALERASKSGLLGMIVFDEFHRCFSYDTLVETDKGPMKIGDIVENKLAVRVFSFNETTKSVELRDVVDWHRNTNVGNMVELTFDIDGVARTVTCTEDHRFYTKNRGWVMAKDLTEEDDMLGL